MMASQDVFVGIDVSKDRLDVHVRPLGVGFSVSNEAAGYAALIARLRPLRVKRIASCWRRPAGTSGRCGWR
jgi:transposase